MKVQLGVELQETLDDCTPWAAGRILETVLAAGQRAGLCTGFSAGLDAAPMLMPSAAAGTRLNPRSTTPRPTSCALSRATGKP
jgi:hypothetical protein